MWERLAIVGCAALVGVSVPVVAAAQPHGQTPSTIVCSSSRQNWRSNLLSPGGSCWKCRPSGRFFARISVPLKSRTIAARGSSS